MRSRAAAYFAVQSAAGAGWWLWLLVDPGARAYFSLPGDPEPTVLVFALADLILFVGGSALAAFALATRRRSAPYLACAVAGATLYAALWCAAATWMRGMSPVGVALMAPAAAASVLCAASAVRASKYGGE